MVLARLSKIGMVMCIASLLFSHTATAQGAKPDHVFQVTQIVVEELEALNGENFTSASRAAKPNDPALPRHVLFLARDQWRKVQLLRFMNGLETHQLSAVSVHDVTPSEVKAMVDKLLIEARDLRPAYGLRKSDISVPLVPGKKPTDVYGSLKQIGAELDALGVPSTVPNDVYRVALTITQAVQKIATKRGQTAEIPALKAETGRSPADAYSASIELMEDLKVLADRNSVFSVPGDILVRSAKSGVVSPDDVIESLSWILADVMAMMNATDADKVLEYAQYIGGKTPTDVYVEIKRAQSIVAALRDS